LSASILSVDNPLAQNPPQNHFSLVKKTPRFTPAVPVQKTSLQKIIQSQTRTTTAALGTKSSSALRNSGSLLTSNKTSTTRSNTTSSLLRKTTPVNTPQPPQQQQQNNSVKSNILKQSLNPGRLTSTPIIDVVDTAENRQKKIEKEERMREAGKNESKKRTRAPSTEQPAKNVKRVVPFTPPFIPGIPGDPAHMNFVPPLFTKEKTDTMEPLQDKPNSSLLFFVWQK